MPVLMLLTLLALIAIQSLSDQRKPYQPVLRAAVIWGGMIVASTELLSLLKMENGSGPSPAIPVRGPQLIS